MRRHHRVSNAALCFALCCLASIAHAANYASNVNTIIVYGAATGSSPRLQAQGTDTNVNLILAPQGSGNVGIGTTTPVAALDVNGFIAADGTSTITSNPPTVGASNGWKLGLYSYSYALGVASNTMAFRVGSNNWVSIFAGNPANNATGTAPDTNATVSFNGTTGNALFNGSVGIGTTSPGALLNLDASAAPGILLSASGTAYATLGAATNANNYSNIAVLGDAILRAQNGNLILAARDASGGIEFSTGGPDTLKAIITSAGNVGIGTTSPAYTLQVNGSVAETSAYNNTSDAHLKKDVQPIAYGLDTVMKLRPVSFNWIAQDQDWKKQHQLGLIAQEVEPVIPEVVTTAKDKMRTKSLAYGELTPVVIKAIQELKADNDKLRADFDAYKVAHP